MTRVHVVALALSAVIMAGCGTGPEPDSAAATSPAPTAFAPDSRAAPPASPDPEVSANPSVPDVLGFSAPTVDGGEFDGASLAGKPAVIWFWAPWCPICKQGAGDVVAAAEKLGSDVAFVGVAGLSGSVEDMQAFVDETASSSIPHIADVDGEVFTRFGVAQQDTFAFVATDGTVTLVDGYGNDPDLVGTARALFGL